MTSYQEFRNAVKAWAQALAPTLPTGAFAWDDEGIPFADPVVRLLEGIETLVHRRRVLETTEDGIFPTDSELSEPIVSIRIESASAPTAKALARSMRAAMAFGAPRAVLESAKLAALEVLTVAPVDYTADGRTICTITLDVKFRYVQNFTDTTPTDTIESVEIAGTVDGETQDPIEIERP